MIRAGMWRTNFTSPSTPVTSGLTLNIPVGKYVVVAPKIQYWYALGGQSTGTLSGLSWDGQA